MTGTRTVAHLPEHVDPGQVLVEIIDPQADDFGRIRFFSYMHDDIRWRGGGMVAAQIHVTRLDEFTARMADADLKVVVMSAS